MSDGQRGTDEWFPWDRARREEGSPSPHGATEPIPTEPTWARSEPTNAPAAPDTPYQPISGSWSATPVGPPPAPLPAPARPERPARGVGRGALLGSVVAVGLLAGTGGGLVGASLAGGDGTGGGTRTAPTAAAPAPGAGATTRAEGTIANIAAKALPSVVTLRVDGADGGSTGSGWVYDDADHVVTNNHVVAGVGDDGEVTVVLADGQQVEGKVIGTDASYDLAVVEVSGADLAPLGLGRSSDVVVGDQVIAVGAPLGLDSTVTAGIVSALDRPVTPGGEDDQSFINAIQTDAAINPGNSGGPLLDMAGRVIGVNSAIAAVPGSSIGGQSGNIGVGFAIPSDQVATTVEQLIETGKAVHPIIGVYLDSTYDGEGVRVAEDGPNGEPAVNPGGPAAEAGLRAGDVIVRFEGKPVTDDGELVVKIRARKVGDSVTLTVRRNGSERDVTMVLQGSE